MPNSFKENANLCISNFVWQYHNLNKKKNLTDYDIPALLCNKCINFILKICKLPVELNDCSNKNP